VIFSSANLHHNAKNKNKKEHSVAILYLLKFPGLFFLGIFFHDIWALILDW
jgi:hypothetical protein